MDNTEGNMDIGLDLLFEQTLILDDPKPVMDKQTDDIETKPDVHEEDGPDTHDVHDVHNVNIIRGKLKVYQYSDEKASRRGNGEGNINEVKMVNTVYKDNEVNEVKETKEVI